jgi:D-alanyl-D-alanine carboxypeptidase
LTASTDDGRSVFVMSPVSALPAIEARISAIQQRIGIRSSIALSPTSGNSVYGAGEISEFSPSDPTKGFDAFGSLYQDALDNASASAVATVSAGATAGAGRAQSYSTGVSGSAATGEDAYFTVDASGWALPATTGASLGKIGGYGPMPVPADLVDYGNGRIPTDQLVPIGQGGHKLYAPAAESWKAAVAAAAADGIDLRITDSYRSYDQQVDLAERKGLYANGGYAATPGTSNHGWGLAVDADVSDPATMSWLRANGYRFGFVEAVPREPWHWEYRPGQA